MNYTVEYVEMKNGKKPFKEFVLSFPIQERAKIFETINYFTELKNQNLPIKESLSKHLEDGIFELRTALAARIARSLFSIKKGQELS